MALNPPDLSGKRPDERASIISEMEPPFDDSRRNIYSMGAPNLSYLREKTAHSTLWILPEQRGLQCGNQYNVVCKFYHAIRCNMLGGFARVRIASNLHQLQQRLQAADIVLLIYFSKDHAEPDDLKTLNTWRNNAANKTVPVGIHVGVFHYGNEKGRTKWPWYTHADFVLRNYWLNKFPPHVQYIPLHHQMPTFCLPESPLQLPGRKTCSCQGRSVPKSSTRPLLYSFSGSLRRSRKVLLKKIRGSKVFKNQPGQLLVSRVFGGDHAKGESPKTRHVSSILDSMFVFAPCGNVMETHRIYEALALGAIPVIENCESNTKNVFFPYRDLLFKTTSEMVAFVESFVDKNTGVLDLDAIDAIQRRMLEWWDSYSRKMAENVVQVATLKVPDANKWAP